MLNRSGNERTKIGMLNIKPIVNSDGMYLNYNIFKILKNSKFLKISKINFGSS